MQNSDSRPGFFLKTKANTLVFKTNVKAKICFSLRTLKAKDILQGLQECLHVIWSRRSIIGADADYSVQNCSKPIRLLQFDSE